MVLHVEGLLFSEDALDELVELLVLEVDEQLDVGDVADLLLDLFSVLLLSKHQRQDRKSQYTGFLHKRMVDGIKRDEQ